MDERYRNRKELGRGMLIVEGEASSIYNKTYILIIPVIHGRAKGLSSVQHGIRFMLRPWSCLPCLSRLVDGSVLIPFSDLSQSAPTY